MKLKTFDEFTTKLKSVKNQKHIDKLNKIYVKLLNLEFKTKQNKYRYEVLRLNYQQMKFEIRDAKKLTTKLLYTKNISPELKQKIDEFDLELDRLNTVVVDGLHKMMINHQI